MSVAIYECLGPELLGVVHARSVEHPKPHQTSADRKTNTASDNPTDLSLFYSLRDISWTGLRSLQEFGTLSCALKNNSKHLRKLLKVSMVTSLLLGWI